MMWASAEALRWIVSMRVSGAFLVQLLRCQHSRPAEHRIQRGPELVRDGREELVLETIGVFGLFRHGLRPNRSHDQALVHLPDLEHDLLQLRSDPRRLFAGADDVLAKTRRVLARQHGLFARGHGALPPGYGGFLSRFRVGHAVAFHGWRFNALAGGGSARGPRVPLPS